MFRHVDTGVESSYPDTPQAARGQAVEKGQREFAGSEAARGGAGGRGVTSLARATVTVCCGCNTSPMALATFSVLPKNES